MSLTMLQHTYLKDINYIASEYGLNAAVFDYKTGTGNNSEGRYLILTPHKSTIDLIPTGGVDLETQLKLQESRPGMLYTNMYLFKIEDKSLHSTMLDVYDYMKRYEIVDTCFREKDLPVPFRIHGGTIEDIIDFSKKRKSTMSSSSDALIEKQYTKYLKELSKRYEKEDSFTAVYNKNRKQEYKNLDKFMEEIKETTKVQVPEENIQEFKEYMKKEPNCSYWISPARKTTDFEIENDSIGSKVKTQTNKYRDVIIDAAYKELVSQFTMDYYAKCGFQTVSYYDMKEATKNEPDALTYTYVSSKNLYKFNQECEKKKIPYAFDINCEYGNSSDGRYPIVYLRKDYNQVNEILVNATNKALEQEKHRIDYYQKANISNLEKEKESKSKKKLFDFSM